MKLSPFIFNPDGSRYKWSSWHEGRRPHRHPWSPVSADQSDWPACDPTGAQWDEDGHERWVWSDISWHFLQIDLYFYLSVSGQRLLKQTLRHNKSHFSFSPPPPHSFFQPWKDLRDRSWISPTTWVSLGNTLQLLLYLLSHTKLLRKALIGIPLHHALGRPSETSRCVVFLSLGARSPS